jgi:outer membrane biosynthesis protein TonB
MGDSRAAVGMDRLPWLSDEPRKAPRRAKRGLSDLTLWVVAGLLVIAAASFWIGSRSQAPHPSAQPTSVQPTTTLPEPRSAPQEVRIAPQPEVAPEPVPEVRPAPVREVHYALPPTKKASETESEKATAAEAQAVADTSQAPESKTAVESETTHSEALKPWPPRVVEGASGRLVEIGAFGSVPQAKVGWEYMVRAYPAMAHLPALVRPDRNSKGRTFYRFRVGTTSQAHSEVLCQRMGKIHLSCAVVGLPWKAKVER